MNNLSLQKLGSYKVMSDDEQGTGKLKHCSQRVKFKNKYWSIQDLKLNMDDFNEIKAYFRYTVL